MLLSVGAFAVEAGWLISLDGVYSQSFYWHIKCQ